MRQPAVQPVVASVLLPFAVFLSAAASLSVELAIVRLGAPYVGQSLLPWSAAIVGVLLGLTAGHVLGGMMSATARDARQVAMRLAGVWLVAGVSTAAMPALLYAWMGMLSGEHGFGQEAVLAVAALAFPPSLAAGFVAPLAVRAAVLTAHRNLPRMVGAIYAASAAGSVLGTAAAGFFLLERVGASGLTSVIAGLWIALGVGVLPWRRLSATQRIGAGVATGTAILSAVVLAVPGPCLQESRYTCIRLQDRAFAGDNLLRFMILDEGVHSASDRDHPARLHLGYAALADRLARAAFASSGAPQALVIGGGGATLPRAWAASPSPVRVTSIELDPMVRTVANDSMWAGNVPALTTMVGDGRAIVRALPPVQTFDVVLMDAYRTRSVPPHLVTREFGQLVAARMTARGVFLSNVIDRAGTPLLALSIARTLSEAFAAVDIWVARADAEGMTNYIVAAWMDPASAHRSDGESVAASIMNAGESADEVVRSRDVNWRRVNILDAASHWPGACSLVLADDRAPVDRLLAGWPMCSR